MSLFINGTVIKKYDIKHHKDWKFLLLLATELQKAEHSNERENFTTVIGGEKKQLKGGKKKNFPVMEVDIKKEKINKKERK